MIDMDVSKFDEIISSGVILLDFWAPWCEPCKMVIPVLEELSIEYKGKINFYKVSADEHPELLQKFGVRGVPTIILLKDGNEYSRIVGYHKKEYFVEKLNSMAS